MKQIKKIAGVCVTIIMIMILTACSREVAFDLYLDDADEIIVRTDLTEITRGELFQMMLSGPSQDRALDIIFDWADYYILSEITDIDEAELQEGFDTILEEFPDMDELNALLRENGFSDWEDFQRQSRLNQLRLTAVMDTIQIEEDDIIEMYIEWFQNDDHENVLMDEPAADDNEANDNENEDEDEDIQTSDMTLEDIDADIIEIIESTLVDQTLQTPGFNHETLASLRADAGFTFISYFLDNAYANYLSQREADADVRQSQQTIELSDEAQIAVAFSDQVMTTETLFDLLLREIALIAGPDRESQLLAVIDHAILAEEIELEENAVSDFITQMMIEWQDAFYPMMNSLGYHTDEEIYQFFELLQLREAFFENNFSPDEARIQELYEQYLEDFAQHQLETQERYDNLMIPRSARHVLVETEEEATDLIQRLQVSGLQGEALEAFFTELAQTYSIEPGADFSGGDLGQFSAGQMVFEFESAAATLNAGQFSQAPVETQFGFHVIFVYDVADEADPDIAESLDALREQLRLTLEQAPLELIAIREQLIAQEMEYYAQNPHHFQYHLLQLRMSHHFTLYDPILIEIYENIRDDVLRAMND